MCLKFADIFDGGQTLWLQTGQLLFSAEQAVGFMFLVEEGGVELVRHTRSGTRLVLSRVKPGAVVAEASAYSKVYHCDGVATGPTKVLGIATATFQHRLTRDARLHRAWAKALAHELQAARVNAELRSLRTVAEKVDVWLEQNNALPPKGEMQALAQVLGVTREALYRELAKRR